MSENTSGYKVPLTTIKEIKEHPNADRLEIAVVYGFEVVIAKGAYSVGDKVIYIPIDSVLPQKLEDELFPPDSKIKLTKHRVRQIRIRKFPSQGMLIKQESIQKVYGFTPEVLEEDYSEKIQVVKYEPPAARFQGQTGTKRVKAKENNHFSKYNGVENIKWYPEKFKPGERVVVQEKIHGTNVRAGILPYSANTLWRKILKFFGLLPKWENCYGSNNVQLQDRRKYKGFYGEDVYGRVLKELDVFNKLQPGETIYGEIYGDGIQKNYTYGCKPGEQKFVLFDVRILREDGHNEWLDPFQVIEFAIDRGFEMVPILYNGPFDAEKIKKMTEGDSVLAPSQKIREGVVIKAETGYDEGMGGKRALKWISEKYLDKDNTDFH